ncbi:MauE/DoxX family redox-associated membrane protein [Rhizomonospora bruguierae]|uniref:MauE/DoxX family redox-associated membrane protein n=1 Tax=Rhizomonospora bruguierae TaxID=1581705 RepID=UPI001BD1958A|nr:MauE/DoxX family redox-associated membrane protein [Micromonospora sp. NBRC 107566]
MVYVSVGLLATLWWVFAASALSKVRGGGAMRAFADSLRPLPLLPGRLVEPVAVLVTAAEVALVVGTAWSVVAVAAGWSAARPGASAVLVLTGLLLAVLTTGVVLAVRRGTGARCACFGAAERPLGRRHVVRNTILLAATATALATVAAAPAGALQLAGLLVAVAAGSIAALILIRLDDLVDLFLPTTTTVPNGRPTGPR